MKNSVIVLIALVVSTVAVPSRETAYDRGIYSRNNRANKFVKEIKEDRGGSYDSLTFHPEFEAVADDDKHMYADFSHDSERSEGEEEDFNGYEPFEGVDAEEIHVSGQSLETEGSDGQKPSYARGTKDDTKTKGSERQLRTNASDVNKSRQQVEGKVDKGATNVNDVEGMSLSGQVHHDQNDIKADGADGGAKSTKEVAQDDSDVEIIELVKEDVTLSAQDSPNDMNEEEAGIDPNYGYRHGNYHIDEVNVKGQAIEHDIEEEGNPEDYDDTDDSDYTERFIDEDWDPEVEDDDGYSDDVYSDDDDDFDFAFVNSRFDDEGQYEDEMADGEDSDYGIDEEEPDVDPAVRVKGMASDKDDIDNEDGEDEYEISDEDEAADDEELSDDSDEFDDVEDGDEEMGVDREFDEEEFEDDDDDADDEEQKQVRENESDDVDSASRNLETSSVDFDEDSYDEVHGDDVDADVEG